MSTEIFYPENLQMSNIIAIFAGFLCAHACVGYVRVRQKATKTGNKINYDRIHLRRIVGAQSDAGSDRGRRC
ncbi:MAG: hypothetical protein J5688_04475, partial [Paludibacteraceae bacterium]|nr:hypothetical protein [Paludibacteraceae bacterium]